MSSSDNKCAACGQWSGRGHRCPTPPLPSPTPITPSHAIHTPPPIDTTDRVTRAQNTLNTQPPATDTAPDRTPPANLITPVPCRRCRGTGFVTARRAHYNVPGLCFKCDGSGYEEGDPERKREIARTKREQKEAYKQLLATSQIAHDRIRADLKLSYFREEDLHKPSQHTVRGGLMALESLEPDRYTHALHAIANGHPTVYQALHDYFIANAERLNSNRNR